MIDKVEVGKRYKLVDKEAYLNKHPCNRTTYAKYFKDDMITVDYVSSSGNGFVDENISSVIGLQEFGLFELVCDTLPLTKLTLPFGELDNQTKKELLCAWVDGSEIERSEYFGEKWYREYTPLWTEVFAYRVKPPMSEKDKLIAAAQQKLKEAQEDLVKAQGL